KDGLEIRPTEKGRWRKRMSDPLQIRTVVSQPFAENSYVAWLPGRSDALVIDPGFEPGLILDFLREKGLSVAAVLNTHGHVDHIAGNAEMKKAFPEAPLIIGANDATALPGGRLSLASLLGFVVRSPAADRTVKEGDVIDAAGIRLEVLDVPGHSPGHVVFL